MSSKKPQKPIEPSDVIAKRRASIATRRGYGKLILRVLLIAAVAWLALNKVFMLTIANGNGMFPAVKDGDLIIGYRLQAKYMKNDVVVYIQNGERKVGRILARETDYVTLGDTGTLIVNGTVQTGEILYPTYAKPGIEYPYRVPEGMVFILGDYRTQAQDSRDFGPIPVEDVEAKVITVLRRQGI